MSPETGLGLLLIVAALATAAWMVWILVANARRNLAARIQADMQAKLLDKLGSSPELLAYLQTEAGQRMLEGVGQQADPPGRILGAMHTGVVLLLLGGGFLTCDELVPGARQGGVFLALGLVSMSLGIGFLISSLLSYVFSRAWGLLGRPPDRSSGRR